MIFISATFVQLFYFIAVKLLLGMTLGQQITILRKKKGLSQADLGRLVETSGDIIGRYERDEVKPSIEVVIRLANSLEVSLDYLVGKSDMELDSATLARIKEITALPDEDRKHIFLVLDALVRDFKAKKAYSK